MKFLLLLSVCTMLIHCKSEKATGNSFQSHIEPYLTSHGYAGEGYAFVAITGIDTVTEKEFLERQMEVLSLGLTNKEARLRRLDSIEIVLKKSLSLQPKDETIITNLAAITRSRTEIYVQQHRMDSLSGTSKPDQAQNVKFIGMDYAFTTKKGSEAPVMHHYYIKLDQQLNVLTATDLRQ